MAPNHILPQWIFKVNILLNGAGERKDYGFHWVAINITEVTLK